MTNVRPTLSATIITRNEEDTLLKLLPRLDWVDEVLVVDSGSTDRTVAIAKQHGCRVLERPFDNFASQRNFALEHAQGDWVLSIDADELPSAGLPEAVWGCIESHSYAGYRIPIRSTIFGRPLRFCGTQDDRPVRLARRDLARWCGDVHETLRVDGRVTAVRAWLEHETLVDFSEFLSKMNHYTALEVQRRLALGQAPRRGERWLSPLLETGRRLIWKWGLLDGPEGWAFCLLSGVSAWVTAERHRTAWQAYRASHRETPAALLKNRSFEPRAAKRQPSDITSVGYIAHTATPARRNTCCISPAHGKRPSGSLRAAHAANAVAHESCKVLPAI